MRWGEPPGGLVCVVGCMKKEKKKQVVPPSPEGAAPQPTVIEVPFSIRDFPDSDRIPVDLYRELRALREWRDQSANSTVLVS